MNSIYLQYHQDDKPEVLVGNFDPNKTTLTPSQFREMFGKKEIDWSKAGQYVKNEFDCVWITTGNHTEDHFEGLCIKHPNDLTHFDGTELFEKYDDILKERFTLCTEPTTLNN